MAYRENRAGAEAAESVGGHAPGAGSRAGGDIHARYLESLQEDAGNPAAKAIAGAFSALVVIVAISLGVNAGIAAHMGAAQAGGADDASAAEPVKLSALMEPAGAGMEAFEGAGYKWDAPRGEWVAGSGTAGALAARDARQEPVGPEQLAEACCDGGAPYAFSFWVGGCDTAGAAMAEVSDVEVERYYGLRTDTGDKLEAVAVSPRGEKYLVKVSQAKGLANVQVMGSGWLAGSAGFDGADAAYEHDYEIEMG